ncbi:WD40 repeat domain-containing protein [Streptomyces sp. NPDC018833]|uniref:WD40 repeat domain-containing protein n=1 Tax=Streptomyces sp. NPDC018833 TaxID=3365053 RepID=UPI00379E3110
MAHSKAVHVLALSPDGHTHLVAGSSDRSLRIWDVAVCRSAGTVSGDMQPGFRRKHDTPPCGEHANPLAPEVRGLGRSAVGEGHVQLVAVGAEP